MFCENTLYLLKASQFVNYQATMTYFQENQMCEYFMIYIVNISYLLKMSTQIMK